MVVEYLFVIPTATLNGGAQKVMFNIIHYLINNNEKVTLVTMSRGKVAGWDVLEKHRNFNWVAGDYLSEKSSLMPITTKLIALDKRHNYKYIFSSHLHINSYLSCLKKLGFFSNSFLISRESSVVFERNTNYKRYFYRLAYKYLYGKQDLLICQTQFMKKSLMKNLGKDPVSNTVVIPNPVNISFIESNIDCSSQHKYIVSCGRLIKLKQFDVLINAFKKITSAYPEHKLIIIGDGEEKGNLINQVNLLSLEEKVVFTGNIKNPYKWFSCADVGIIASSIEGFPNVLLEMMASGTSKIVTTPCAGGLKDIPNIIVTENCSEYSIIESLIEALGDNHSYSEKFKKTIKERYSVESFWNTVLSYL